ncbi:MAG: hypothetical protein AAB225_11120 [Acidobacteriota bacterium]
MQRWLVICTVVGGSFTVFCQDGFGQGPPVDRVIMITARSDNRLEYRDPGGNPAERQKALANETVTWKCCTLPAGETVVGFDVSFSKRTPFCKNKCTADDPGNDNNKGTSITKRVKSSPAKGIYKYAVAVVSRDGKGNVRLYMDDPEIDVE